MKAGFLLNSSRLQSSQLVIWIALASLLCLPACKPRVKDLPGLGKDDIRINQIGYFPSSPKKAVVVDSTATEFELRDTTGKTIFSGSLTDAGTWDKSGEAVKIADFSSFTSPGSYYIYVAGKGASYVFQIKPRLYSDALCAALKSYYYQRCSMPLEEKYAGIYARAKGHPDSLCYFHPSTGHTAGNKSSAKGWYDAGDYNKYIVNTGVTLGMLLDLAEFFPSAVPDNFTNIPESGNGVSDLLDEIRYELDWVLSMQDKDGGVFNKLTNLGFDAFEMPDKAIERRYFVGKSTTAALDFAANTAQAARVFLPVDKAYAETLLKAAKSAYAWAKKHPDIVFENPKDVSTGGYGDKDFKDEFFWAAAELYVTTTNEQYLDEFGKYQAPMEFPVGENWRQFPMCLGCFSLASAGSPLPEAKKARMRNDILMHAGLLIHRMDSIPYRIPLNDFQWGSNSDFADASMLFGIAWMLSKDKQYLDAAVETTDYLFGKNATGYCFVTGLGSKNPMNPHHRPSGSDGIEKPIPGFLVGGPNSRLQDTSSGANYASILPAKCYSDMMPSYASNEVAINWNAPLVFVLGFLEEEMGQ